MFCLKDNAHFTSICSKAADNNIIIKITPIGICCFEGDRLLLTVDKNNAKIKLLLVDEMDETYIYIVFNFFVFVALKLFDFKCVLKNLNRKILNILKRNHSNRK